VKRTGFSLLALAAAVVLCAVGCTKSSDQSTVAVPSGPPSLTLGSVPSSVDGNVVTIPAQVSGIKIVEANGDTSGKTGHFHVFIDRQPVAIGATVPKEPGIVHSASNPIKIYGLKIGTHTFHVVLGDGAHRRLPGAPQTVTVEVKGPSVWGVAPATIAKGATLTIQLHAEGFDVMPVAEGNPTASPMASASPGASALPGDPMQQGHYHILVDPSSPPKAGETLPEPEANKVIHTGASSVTISGLTPGMHTIWIVAGSMTHVAFDPPVMDKLTVTVLPG
jgi:hypothetical protein